MPRSFETRGLSASHHSTRLILLNAGAKGEEALQPSHRVTDAIEVVIALHGVEPSESAGTHNLLDTGDTLISSSLPSVVSMHSYQHGEEAEFSSRGSQDSVDSGK